MSKEELNDKQIGEYEKYMSTSLFNTRTISAKNTSIFKDYYSDHSIDRLFININNFDTSVLRDDLNVTYLFFTKTLYSVLIAYRELVETINSNPFRINSDESSVFIEWLFPEFRCGFTIEANEINCFVVSAKRLGSYVKSMKLDEDNPVPLLNEIIKYALENY